MRQIILLVVAAILGAAAPTVCRAGHFPSPKRTDSNMSILIEHIAGVDLVDSAEVACLTPGGYVAGVFVVDTSEHQWGGPAWGDDATTEAIDGFRDGDTLSFLYWDPVSNWEHPIAVEVVSGGAAIYHSLGILVLDFTVSVRDESPELPAGFGLSSPYPNPFNGWSNVTVSIASRGTVNLSLRDMLGRTVLSIYSGSLTEGRHTIALDAAMIPAGFYRIVLEENGRTANVPAVLLK